VFALTLLAFAAIVIPPLLTPVGQISRLPEATLVACRANELIAALPRAVCDRLHTRIRHVRAQETLFDCLRRDMNVYFPHPGTVVSLVRSTDEGPQLEVGMIGSEGCASLDILLGGVTTDSIAIVLVSGDVTCIDGANLRAEFSSDVITRTIVNSYAAMFIEQVSQTAVCHGVHTIGQRLSKWLLTMRERTCSSDISVSHESLSHLLGAHRPAVTLAIGALNEEGVITHSRGSIQVRDARGLRARSCGCFELMERRLAGFRAMLGARTRS
jgi:hypothetical protein